MINDSLKNHINEINNPHSISAEELNQFIEKFKVLGNTGINSNSIFYILNLNTLNYEYINDACRMFSGLSSKIFYEEGLNILPQIIVKNDFNLLSKRLFPKMNTFSKNLSAKRKSKIIFEIYYKMQNRKTGEIKQIVEFSSYSKFNEDGSPILSTGMCFESTQQIHGVKGIVRLNQKNEQLIIFEENLTSEALLLTKTEKNIANFLIEGISRKEIASKLNISHHTINTHARNIYKKLNINKVSELKNKLR